MDWNLVRKWLESKGWKAVPRDICVYQVSNFIQSRSCTGITVNRIDIPTSRALKQQMRAELQERQAGE